MSWEKVLEDEPDWFILKDKSGSIIAELYRTGKEYLFSTSPLQDYTFTPTHMMERITPEQWYYYRGHPETALMEHLL